MHKMPETFELLLCTLLRGETYAENREASPANYISKKNESEDQKTVQGYCQELYKLTSRLPYVLLACLYFRAAW